MADEREQRNYVSMGRNPNFELTCGFPICGHLDPGANRSGGWCKHPDNRVPPCSGWPNGFTPSVASTGGCDLHTSNVAAPSSIASAETGGENQ